MRRTPANLPEIQDKRAAVIRLRAEGRTWQQVADLAGYSTASGALKAWRKAVQQHPDQTVDEIRAQEKTRLEEMDSELARIIDRPPIRTTSIGRVMYDIRTCECGAGNTPTTPRIAPLNQSWTSARCGDPYEACPR